MSTERKPDSKSTVEMFVGGFVFLAYYWTGFTDDPAEVLEICDSRRTANAVIRTHKRERDPSVEYGHRANWWVKRQAVRTANKGVTGDAGGGVP